MLKFSGSEVLAGYISSNCNDFIEKQVDALILLSLLQNGGLNLNFIREHSKVTAENNFVALKFGSQVANFCSRAIVIILIEFKLCILI